MPSQHTDGRDDAAGRFYMLALAALTCTFTVAMPAMCMPVLFDEISADLGLNLVQMGSIWGLAFLPGAFVGLIGGPLGDRFGAKPTLVVFCLLSALAGASRGLAGSFGSLAITTLLYGTASWIVPMSINKMCMQWFSRSALGFASGVVSMGMALGFLCGALFSASVLSPLLGGWQGVLFFYGAVSMVIGFLWCRVPAAPARGAASTRAATQSPIGLSLARVTRIKTVWLLGGSVFGVSGCVNGLLGYLPIYLRAMGWPENLADGALGTFHAVSMVSVVPISLLSDRLGARKWCLVVPAGLIALGTGMLSVATGLVVWLAILMAGMVRDGFMAVLYTMTMETKGVGAAYAGTGVGFVMMFSALGGLTAPPLGNSLAHFNPAGPFLLWSGLGLAGFVCSYFVREGLNSQ